ncbi:DEAD/DEAH box helicase family protein [Tritrichomonas foetus]|uniref:DEAD/DEAH box helicase family protein n=1 Tax=Tritrichomonas foetus TaxID=1144522 RepID=A0A1J4JI06_9EUKA|nr:DEAD/DEAH box helicase family protein [Tritrichomonas foetus]|eukprot:OHS98808.1 DEAD/DEAH box helicase family protein [Tritrichomonas foetus]
MEFDFILNSFDFDRPGLENEFLYPPYRLASQRYIGIGDQRITINNDDSFFTPDVLRIDPTPPTTMIAPIRDLLTGEISEYRDIPISSAASDDSAINRPLGSNIDNYHIGANSGVAFTPGGFIPEKRNVDLKIDQFLLSLETGTNLLSTPFDDTKKVDNTENSDDLPNLPEFESLDKVKPTPPPRPTQQVISEITKTYAVTDTWDVSLFSQEIPNPALTFPYKLDTFQLRAIHRLELNQCVFVSAPTSAGKTVVAQYAIALCRAHKMRTLYTSPIKALSNQKFRDLSKQFGDVGLLTGDVSLNKDASCIIMTTEILRSMLYKGADILRDVECVIFDECHYIANDERGVVWEESIILLPYHINMVFLSATVPNAKEIADWIGRTKQRVVYVEEHHVRPVPIEHALYTGDSNFYVIGRTGRAIDPSKLLEAQQSIKTERGRIDFSSHYWMVFVLSAEASKLLPIIVFCFSKKMCEELAENLLGVDLLTKAEKKHVVGFCRRALMRLNKEDRELPQIMTMFQLLEAGVAVHHSGVLPILKEMVEILLAEGYVKVLFCTSTFAMGLNVPARSCAFISLEKFNGKNLTKLTPTEFVQMSGRAGRRGLDTVGTSIIMCWGDTPMTEDLRQLMSGKVEALQSQFKLKFNMILNLLRCKDIKMVDVLRRSLSANILQAKMPELLKKMNDTEKALKALPPIDCHVSADIEDMGGFGDHIWNLKECSQSMLKEIDHHSILNQLRKGRVVYIYEDSVNKDSPTLAVISEKPISTEEIRAIAANGKDIVFNISCLAAIFGKPTKATQRLNSSDIKTYLAAFNEMPLEWTKVFSTSDYEFTQIAQEHASYYNEVRKSPCFRCSRLKEHLVVYNQKVDMICEIEDCQRKIADESLAFKPLLDSHIKCLKDLGYVTEDNVLMLKGRVSIELSSCHEILGTELLFSGIFDPLNPIEIASACAALVSESSSNSEVADLVPASLEETFAQMTTIAKALEQTFAEHNISVDDNWVDNNVNLSLVQAVFDWAAGMSFRDIMYITDIPEGSVVRVINRVSETLKDFANAAKLMGCLSLSDKFEVSMEMIKRDIIFASSLYFD